MRLQQLAEQLWPYLQKFVERSARATGSSGGGVVGGAPSPHALSGAHHTGGITDAQGAQFLLTDGTRSLNGNLAVAAGKTVDGVDISAHAINPDAHHSKQHLITGGDHTIVGSALQVVGATATNTLGLLTPSSDVGTTPAAALLKSGASGELTLATLTLYGNLAFTGADRSITSTAGVDVTIDLGGDLILASADTFRSFDYADGIPIAGFSLHQNGGGQRQLTINTIKTDEFHTRLFVADAVRIDIGEEYWGKSMGIVHTDWTTPLVDGNTVTIKFEDSALFAGALFSNNDWILLRYLDDSAGFAFGSIWGQVSSYSDLGNDSEGRGHQSWTFTMRDGANSQLVKRGTVAVCFGASGQGYVHLSTLDSADGPWIQIGEWAGANPYTPGNRTIGTQIGSLDNISDADLNPAGYGLYSDNAYLKGAIRTAETMMDDDGFSLLHPDVSSNTSPGSHSRIDWWEDINDRTGNPRARIASWRSTLSSPVLFNWLTLNVRDDDADAAILNISAIGSDTVGILLDSRGVIGITGQVDTEDVLPNIDDFYDLGSASYRWKTVYADEVIVTGSISGTVLSGGEWEHPASMVIDANSASNTTVSIANQGAGRADLDVDRNITLGGTVDGVDVSVFSAAYTAHIADPAAHHALVTSVNTAIAVSGQALTFTLGANSGLSISSGLIITPATAGAGMLMTSGVINVVAAVGGGLTVNANDMEVDSTVVRTTRTVSAGTGMTGGGALSANITLNVIGGDGITANADDIAVDGTVVRTTRVVGTSGALAGGGALSSNLSLTLTLGSNSGLDQTSGLIIAPATAGAGMLMTSGVINVVAANGSLTVNANDMNVNLAHAFVWSGSHTWNTGVFTFNTDPQIGGDLDFIGSERTITSASTTNLNISPGGDLVLNPTGSDVLPGGNNLIDLGDYNRKFRTLFASELYVETLVAQDVLATIGGRVMVAPTTALIADMTNVQTTIDVKHNNLSSGCFIFLQTAPAGVAQIEAMKVTSGSTPITGGYRYTVVRNQDGTGANTWVTGDAVVNLGAAVGTGYIDLTSTSTIHSHLGPTITIYARTATTNWNDTKPVVTMGNLDSFVGYGTEYGFGVGNDLTLTPATGFSGLTADRTNGVRMFNTDLALYVGSAMTVKIDNTNGLNLKTGSGAPNRVSWVDAPSAPFPSTLAFIGHLIAAPYDMLLLRSQGSANDGAIELRATSLSSNHSLWIDNTGFTFGNGASTPTAAQVKISDGGLLGVGTGSPIAPGHFYQNNASVTTDIGVLIEQGGTGDAVLRWKLAAAAVTWSAGADNSNGDRFTIAAGPDLSGTPAITINPSTLAVGVGSAATNPLTTLHVDGNSLWVKGTGSGGLASGAGSGIRISSTGIFSYDYGASTPNTLTLQSPGGAVAITGAATVGSTLGVTGNITAAGINVGEDTLTVFDEDTWTPALTGSASNPTVTYTSRYGAHTLINKLCSFQSSMLINAYSGGSGILRISLPATSHSTGVQTASVWWYDATSNYYSGVLYIPASAAYAQIILSSGGFLQVSGLATTDILTIGGNYYTA